MDLRSFYTPKSQSLKTETPSTGLSTNDDGTTYRLTLNGRVAWEGQMPPAIAASCRLALQKAIDGGTPEEIQKVADDLNDYFHPEGRKCAACEFRTHDWSVFHSHPQGGLCPWCWAEDVAEKAAK